MVVVVENLQHITVAAKGAHTLAQYRCQMLDLEEFGSDIAVVYGGLLTLR